MLLRLQRFLTIEDKSTSNSEPDSDGMINNKNFKPKGLQKENIFSERRLNYFYTQLKENSEFKDRISKKLLLGVFKRNSYKNFKRIVTNREDIIVTNIEPRVQISSRPPERNFPIQNLPSGR